MFIFIKWFQWVSHSEIRDFKFGERERWYQIGTPTLIWYQERKGLSVHPYQELHPGTQSGIVMSECKGGMQSSTERLKYQIIINAAECCMVICLCFSM